MGNSLCRDSGRSGSSLEDSVSDFIDFLTCDSPPEDSSEREIVLARQEGVTGDRTRGLSQPGQPGAFSGSGLPPKVQRQGLPGESCIVTPGESLLVTAAPNPYAAPVGTAGESMVVTGSGGTAVDRYAKARAEALGAIPESSVVSAAPGTYKVGEKVEIWSASQNAWCLGIVAKVEGELVQIDYKGKRGESISKNMPIKHEHIRYPTGAVQEAVVQAPAAAMIYSVGDRVEIYSTSQGKWCLGRVDKIDGANVHIAYSGREGVGMTKIMPSGHQELRVPESVNTEMELSLPPPPPPPAKRTFVVGDSLELWSVSQNAWCPGTVEKIEGDWITIHYIGANGQAMNKVMPSNHAHLRAATPGLYGGTSALPNFTPIGGMV